MAHEPNHCLNQTPAGDLLEAVDHLARAGSTDDIIEVIRSTARQLVGSDGIALVLRDGDNCHYVEEDAVGPLWKGHRFAMSECISGGRCFTAGPLSSPTYPPTSAFPTTSIGRLSCAVSSWRPS